MSSDWLGKWQDWAFIQGPQSLPAGLGKAGVNNPLLGQTGLDARMINTVTETELGPVQIQVQSDEELGSGGPSNLGEDIGPATH